MKATYGRGSRTARNSGEVLSRDQVLDLMRFLGYDIKERNGELTDQAYKTASALAGLVKENIMLPVLIAQEYAKHY